MPNNTSITRKSRAFNLIRRKVDLKETVKVERDWYVLFNVLFVCLMVIISGISLLYKVYIERDLQNKKATLAAKVNSSLNTNSKEIIRSEIAILNDKFGLYQDFLNQNFDVNTFYNTIQGIYPGIKISKFSAQPNASTIEVTVQFDSNGYTEFPKFVHALEENQNFKNATIRGVNFSLKDSVGLTGSTSLVDQKNTPEGYITEVSLSVSKVAPEQEPTQNNL